MPVLGFGPGGGGWPGFSPGLFCGSIGLWLRFGGLVAAWLRSCVLRHVCVFLGFLFCPSWLGDAGGLSFGGRLVKDLERRQRESPPMARNLKETAVGKGSGPRFIPNC